MHTPIFFRSPGRLAATAMLLALLMTGCMGIDTRSVRTADTALQEPIEAHALATGRVQFMIDGQPMAYGLLNKPRLSLYHRQRRVLMSSPETQADGRYRWQLPAGDYTVAVIFGGLSPADQPLQLPGGQTVFVNGIVDPGLSFSLPARAAVDLGTLVVEVESRPASGLLPTKERAFARLLGLRVEPSASPTSGTVGPLAVSQAMRVHGAGAPGPTITGPQAHPGVLAPLIPLLIR